jgi:hypothetical protein
MGSSRKAHAFLSLLKRDLQRLGFGVQRAITRREAEVRLVRVKWVVVTDMNGNPRFQLRWRAK